MDNNIIAEPFFVWIGGKRRLINQYQNLYPRELKNGTIKRYIECFLGSGAMFLENLCNNENLLKINKILESTTIKYGDYTECKEYINSCTFIYCDPPYRPTENSGIIKYNKKLFDENNQRELKSFCDYASNKGAYTMISNSYSEDGFFQNLYDGYNLNLVNKYSCVASNNKYRKPIKEVVITNY